MSYRVTHQDGQWHLWQNAVAIAAFNDEAAAYLAMDQATAREFLARNQTVAQVAAAIEKQYGPVLSPHEAARVSVERYREGVADGRDASVQDLWQPIETAPKDGSHILAHGPYQWEDYDDRQETGVVVIYWKEGWSKGNGFWRLINTNPYEDRCQATHWMPLPVAPTAPQ